MLLIAEFIYNNIKNKTLEYSLFCVYYTFELALTYDKEVLERVNISIVVEKAKLLKKER